MKQILSLFDVPLLTTVLALHTADVSASKPNVLLILLEDDGQLVARPEYYGMLAFAMAVASRLSNITLQRTSAVLVRIH